MQADKFLDEKDLRQLFCDLDDEDQFGIRPDNKVFVKYAGMESWLYQGYTEANIWQTAYRRYQETLDQLNYYVE